jgi:hypothetical protein
MSVEDKIKTLESALLDETVNCSFDGVPETGLAPFDAATKNYAAYLIETLKNE